jgi:hypothetical protein
MREEHQNCKIENFLYKFQMVIIHVKSLYLATIQTKHEENHIFSEDYEDSLQYK